jgi:hypothetical protein
MPLAYDDIPGSWGQMSEGWPETPYTPAKWLLCTKADIVPYGSYVVVGAKQRPFRFADPEARGGYDYSEAVIRVETEALKASVWKGLPRDVRGLPYA